MCGRARRETPNHLPAILSTSASQITERPPREVLPALKVQLSRPLQPKPLYKDVVPAKIDDDSEPQDSLKRATTKASFDAPVTLANMYLEGKGAPRNCDEALSLLETAAAQANVRAQSPGWVVRDGILCATQSRAGLSLA